MYKLLEVGEILNEGDEIFTCAQWVKAEFRNGEKVGDGRFNIPIRRKIESGSGQNTAELAGLILQKYKRNVDPSIRCCNFLKEAVIEVLNANSLLEDGSLAVLASDGSNKILAKLYPHRDKKGDKLDPDSWVLTTGPGQNKEENSNTAELAFVASAYVRKNTSGGSMEQAFLDGFKYANSLPSEKQQTK